VAAVVCRIVAAVQTGGTFTLDLAQCGAFRATIDRRVAVDDQTAPATAGGGSGIGFVIIGKDDGCRSGAIGGNLRAPVDYQEVQADRTDNLGAGIDGQGGGIGIVAADEHSAIQQIHVV